MRPRVTMLNLAAVVVLAGCATPADSDVSETHFGDVDAALSEGAVALSVADLEGEWVPVTLFGEEIAHGPVRRVSVRFSADTATVGARNGCNLYLGTFDLGEQGRFAVAWESITREACVRPSGSGGWVSDAYPVRNPEALDAAEKVQASADRLEFVDAQGSVVAAYRRA